MDPVIINRGLIAELPADAYMIGSLFVIGGVVFLAWKFSNFLVRRKPPAAPLIVTGHQGDLFYSSASGASLARARAPPGGGGGGFKTKESSSATPNNNTSENIEMRTLTFKPTSDGATSPSISPAGPSGGSGTVSQQGHYVTGTTSQGLRKRSAGVGERSSRASGGEAAAREQSIKQPTGAQQRSSSEGRPEAPAAAATLADQRAGTAPDISMAQRSINQGSMQTNSKQA